MNLLSPSDIVGPSPVTSNGTETTEIEDDASEEVHRAHMADGSASRNSEVSPAHRLKPHFLTLMGAQLLVLATNLPDSMRQPSSDEAVSVIHAPESFAIWVGITFSVRNRALIHHP